MWCKPYGQTGKQTSVIGFGGMRFANPTDIDANAAVVLHAYERGINYFDTAPNYCRDKSEEIMGAAFRHMEPGTFYASSKCMAADGDAFRRSLERTLGRLGLETVHFFHIWCIIHADQWRERQEGGAVAAALRAKEEGLVEHVVVSSHLSGAELARVLEEGPFEGVTLGYSAINFPYREEAVRAAGRLGLGVVTMNPLGGGVIPRHADRFDFLRGPDDPSAVAAALRFNVSNPHVTTALVGFTTCEHVDEAVDAVEDFEPWPATRVEDTRARILESFEGLCTGCGYCVPCPVGIDIPRFMDAYNQRILAGDDPKPLLDRLKWHWAVEPRAAAVCSLCGQCEERCTQHLPIRDRLKAIASLAEGDA
jgi:predicted aldo/keto reductase-like oxidoreductase